MDVDKLLGFSALEQYGIHVARSAYVDSAESAIAFAERRDAPDPRFMPIVLRSTAALAGRQEPLKSIDVVREAYMRLSGEKSTVGEKLLAQVFIADGSDVAITGTSDAKVGKMISLGGDIHSVGRAVPLTAASAESLAANYREYGHHGSNEKARRMLEHLLMRVSKFFEKSGVTDVRLDVRLHDNNYSVVDASMHAPAPLHFKRRLAHRAHDRKGDEYHTGGRQ